MWPLVGWLTGGVAAGVLWLASLCLPPIVAVALALTARVLLTGALHEDGLADFFDGFGGGHTRERVLEIMKDSHIGTYGVLALIIYFIMMVTTLSSLSVEVACLAIIAADPWSKWCTSQIVNVLPYARTEETSKSHVVYAHMSTMASVLSLVLGLLPSLLIIYYVMFPMVPMGAAMIVAAVLMLMMNKRIDGYTGDCCGATFLMSELAYYVSLLAVRTVLCN